MKIKFCGATEGVTGSCHLIQTEHTTFLLDCGMFQGSKKMEAKNRERFPFDVSSVDFVLLSHAHVDHCGRLPLLAKYGFYGQIYTTDATADLLDIMLRDCAHIQAKETEYLNKKNDRLGRQHVEPLYGDEEVQAALELVHPVLYDSKVRINDEVTVRFVEAGHILGSASIEIWITEKGKTTKLVFSGDIGQVDRPILRDPKYISEADIVLMETTYGNRLHPESDEDVTGLRDAVMRTIKRGGTVLIPAFAVGRTQDMIYYFNKLFREDSVFAQAMKDITFYVDSPMALNATEVFKKNAQVFDSDSRDTLLSGDNPLNFANLHFVQNTLESQALNEDNTPKVIISASGMCEAGRIKHHLKHNLWDSRNSVLFVGYQAEGTLGRKLVDGQEVVHIFSEPINVAAEIYDFKGFSGHADREGLLNWLSAFTPAPDMVFLVHGEEQAKKDFAEYVKQTLGFEPVPVLENCTVNIDEDKLEVLSDAVRDPRAAKKEELSEMRRKLAEVHHALEHLLYTTQLAPDDSLTEERMDKLNDILLQLEKNTLNLGSEVTDIQTGESGEITE